MMRILTFPSLAEDICEVLCTTNTSIWYLSLLKNPKCNIHLSKLTIVFVQIENCNCPNWELYLSKLQNVFLSKSSLAEDICEVFCTGVTSSRPLLWIRPILLWNRKFPNCAAHFLRNKIPTKFKLKRLGMMENISRILLLIVLFSMLTNFAAKVNIESPFRRHKSFSKVSGELDNTMFHDVRATPPPPAYD